MTTGQIPITLAHSADADDVYMWWPITGMLSPEAPHAVVSPPEVDTGPFRIVAEPGDIGEFNRRAIASSGARPGPEVVAISYAALAHCHDRYGATSFGSSFGDGYGPSLVTRPSLAGRGLRPLAGATVAVPGLATSAAITLRIVLPDAGLRLVEAPFDQISGLVRTGEVDAGLIIHEEKLVYRDLGLVEVLDLGLAWRVLTGLPLPLGANAVRLDLDRQHGPGTVQRLVNVLQASLRHARAHHARSSAYAWRWASRKLPLRELGEQYLDLYVSSLTDDATGRGERAIHEFHRRAAAIVALPSIPPVRLLSGQ